MSDSGVDHKRRRFLIGATSVVGATGAAAVAAPFLLSFKPSARALAAGAPAEVNISKMEPGQQVSVIWRGKPVWVVRRTKDMLAALPKNNALLKDPDSNASIQPEYAKNATRAIKEEYLVMIGICTHLGCSPTYRPEVAAADMGADWNGGWYCPCHGSKFDLAGRVYQNVPAGTNMEIPPYYFKADDVILIGESGGQA